MRELELLRHIAERSADLAGRGGVVVGPGDDAAVLRATGDLLVCVDALVEGRHYNPGTASLDDIAHKAVARNVSDIAAMGGSPRWGLASAALRRGFDDADGLFDRMARVARAFGCPLVGGDVSTVDGPTVLSVTVIGEPHAVRGPVLRSGARPGDAVFVTGAIGGAVGSGRHLRLAPRTDEAHALCDTLGARLTAMIDVSDGLGLDASRLAEASGVRVELDADAIPLHPDAGDWRAACAEGEDYELLFCAGAGGAPIPGAIGPAKTAVTRIGEVTAGSGCAILAGGASFDGADLGWEHPG